MPVTSSRTPSPEIVENLEKQLKVSLRPVQPNPEFIDHLHNRLTSSPAMTLERQNTVLSLLLVAFSLLSGIILIWVMRHLRSAEPV